MITAERYHDISCGHRVYGHESKCAHLHGHNYRVFFVCTIPELDKVGRVIDFSVMKEKLCMFLEDSWDHKMLIYK
jgi:6-pyruvoyltetrahydropterin/6-carboxytetrahydropterin synthase